MSDMLCIFFRPFRCSEESRQKSGPRACLKCWSSEVCIPHWCWLKYILSMDNSRLHSKVFHAVFPVKLACSIETRQPSETWTKWYDCCLLALRMAMVIALIISELFLVLSRKSVLVTQVSTYQCVDLKVSRMTSGTYISNFHFRLMQRLVTL